MVNDVEEVVRGWHHYAENRSHHQGNTRHPRIASRSQPKTDRVLSDRSRSGKAVPNLVHTMKYRSRLITVSSTTENSLVTISIVRCA